MSKHTDSPEIRIQSACNIAYRFASFDGAHHKQWVIDQMLRTLLREKYDQWVEDYKEPDYPDWDVGIAP